MQSAQLMSTIKIQWASFLGSLGIVAACAASQQAPPPQEPIPGTASEDGVTAEQRVADEQVVERIAAARCDRDESCNRIGPGAVYRNREDCMTRKRLTVLQDVNAGKCPGGIGEVALNRCIKSIENGSCDMPGQIIGETSHCHLSVLCLKR